MDTKLLLQELRAESDRIDRAITAIEGISADGASRSTTSAPTKRRGGISAAGRKRLSMLMRKRWASGKMKRRPNTQPHARKAAPKSTAAKKASRKGGITAAGRKRLSEMMKKRWAARKKEKAATA